MLPILCNETDGPWTCTNKSCVCRAATASRGGKVVDINNRKLSRLTKPTGVLESSLVGAARPLG